MQAQHDLHAIIQSGQESLPAELDRVEQVPLASQLVNVLVRAAKAARVFTPGHQLHQEFQQRLRDLFDQYLSRYHSLELFITETSISMHGMVLYTCDDVRAGIPFLFYRDGVRALRFSNGITEAEIHGLLQAVRQREVINNHEDDLVTLLWECDFLHLEFEATDAYLAETGALVQVTPEEFRRNRTPEAPAHQVADSMSDEALDPAGWDDLLPPLLADKELYRLSAEDRAALQREVKEATSTAVMPNTINVLFDMLPLLEDRDTYRAVTDLLTRLLKEMFILCDYARVCDVLLRVGAMLCTLPPEDWQVTCLRDIIDSVEEAQWHDLICYLLQQPAQEMPAKRMAAFELLQPKPVLAVLIRIYDSSEQERTRAVLIEALAVVGQIDLDALLDALSVAPHQHMGEIVVLLSQVGDKRAVPYLSRALEHRDAQVRKAVVTTLGKIGGFAGLRYLMRAVEDKDEGVRLQAITALGQCDSTNGVEALLSLVRAPSFSHRSHNEIKTILGAIVPSSSKRTLDTLERLVRPRFFFKDSQYLFVRNQAIRVLSSMNSPEARVILERAKYSAIHLLFNSSMQTLGRMFRPGNTRTANGK